MTIRPPAREIATNDVAAMTQTGGPSGIAVALSSMSMPTAIATAAAIPLIQDVDRAEYIKCRLTSALSDARLHRRTTKPLYPERQHPAALNRSYRPRVRSNALLDGFQQFTGDQ